MTSSSISTAYVDYVLNQGTRPPSVKSFADSLGIKEGTFYESYASFLSLEQQVFQSYLESAIEKLSTSQEYAEYGTPEKLAGLFFFWLGELLENRSFVVFLHHQSTQVIFTPYYMETAAPVFEDFVRTIIKDGIAAEEVADRLFAPKFYRQWLWLQARWVFRFWIGDTSKNFEKTDEAVEKMLRLTYDVIRPNSIDSGWDVIKFLWRNR